MTESAKQKRARRAEQYLAMPFMPITPTNSAGAMLRRGDHRRSLKAALDTIPSLRDAAAARERHAATKGRVRRRKPAARKATVLEPEEKLTRGERKVLAREFAMKKEADRQREVADKIISRLGADSRQQVYSQFGCLAADAVA